MKNSNEFADLNVEWDDFTISSMNQAILALNNCIGMVSMKRDWCKNFA